MTEQTDKIKICDIIVDCFTKEGNFKWSGHLVPKLADALIAAGIGDVSEYKHRAERAERALKNACEDVKEIVSFLIELSERVDGLHVEGYLPEESEPKAYINRAEKELAEERKDD